MNRFYRMQAFRLRVFDKVKTKFRGGEVPAGAVAAAVMRHA